jgi:hypothetical protein
VVYYSERPIRFIFQGQEVSGPDKKGTRQVKRLTLILTGMIFLGQIGSGYGEIKPNPRAPAGPFGRPVLPGPQKKRPPVGSLGLLAPGPPLLRAPLPLPGPLPGTVLVPGHWQGNRWVPGRLEWMESRP